MVSFQPNGLLPPGIHILTWEETEQLLVFNSRRRELFSGFKRACESLKKVGCTRVYLDGSFATTKEFPGDFDGCWDESGVDFAQGYFILISQRINSLSYTLSPFKRT